MKPNQQLQLFFGSAVVLFIVDRLLKYVVLNTQTASLTSIISFQLFKNTGLVASIPAPPYSFLFISIIGCAALAIAFIITLKKRRFPLALALFWILLGALSNSYDRLAYQFTVDYFIFFGRSAVNIADGMIVTGVILLLSSSRQGKKSVFVA